MNPNFRNFALWVIIFLLVVALVMLFQNPGQKTASTEINFSHLLTEVDQSHVPRRDDLGSRDHRAFHRQSGLHGLRAE